MWRSPRALPLRNIWSRSWSSSCGTTAFTRLEEVELVDEDVRFSLPAELTRAASALDDDFRTMSHASLRNKKL